MERVGMAWQQFGATWHGMPLTRRLIVAGGTLAVLAGLLSIIMWGLQPGLAPLMTNLNEQDASQIVEQLQQERIPHALASGGTTVLVPEDRVYELRLKFAGKGIPKGGGVGFEIFDKPVFGMSRFAEQLNYVRALEGELQRTLRRLDGVRDARVHVVQAEKSLFKSQEQDARASVTLHMQPGRRLDGNQVQAVVHLVASSVPDLTPSQVTVIDGAGNVLARGGAPTGDLSNTLEHQQTIEQRLEARITEIVERVVGSGRATVRVNAELDNTTSDKTSETFDPDATAMRSEQTTEETHAAQTSVPAGIPGVRSNLAGVTPGATTPNVDTGKAGRRSETRNYEVSKIVNHETTPRGRLSRLTVAVLVDGIREKAADGTETWAPRSPESLAQLATLVKTSVGFNAERGDDVTVQSLRFDTGLEPAAEELASLPSWVKIFDRAWRPVIVALGILTLLVLLFRRRRAFVPPPTIGAPRSVKEIEAQLASRPSMNSGAPAGFVAASSEPEVAGRPDPERAAAVIRTWLEEG